MQEGHQVRGGGARAEDGEPDDGLGGDVLLVKHEEGKAYGAEEERHQCVPGGPRVHHAAPGYGDEEAGGGGDEEDRAEPVDALEFREDGARDEFEPDEEWDGDGGDGYEGEVDVEDPAL